MPLVSSLVLTHGSMLFDGGNGCTAASAERLNKLPETLKGDCQTLFKAACEATEMAKATKPEVIFLYTPHGIGLSDSYCVYLNSKAKGNAEWNDQWTEYDVNVDLDVDLAKSFVEHLRKDGVSAEGMLASAVCETPLHWGEVIPLWFFKNITAAGVKVVIFSEPLQQGPLSKVIEVGQSIARFLNGLDQRVLYIASGDLSHSHETDCTLPLYLPDLRARWAIPKSDKAMPFDICVENWVKCVPYSSEGKEGPTETKEKRICTWDSAKAEPWLSEAFDLKQVTLSCGINGFGVLHGVLGGQAANFDAHLLCRFAPTYFGMMVAAFIRK